jgi:hypothetical protein
LVTVFFEGFTRDLGGVLFFNALGGAFWVLGAGRRGAGFALRAVAALDDGRRAEVRLEAGFGVRRGAGFEVRAGDFFLVAAGLRVGLAMVFFGGGKKMDANWQPPEGAS